MASLKAAMAWDEQVYGREYDLDQFNIVAVDDFNFGAMENKGLNIFNSRYILADQDTATDADFDGIAARRRATNISTIGRATGSPAATGSSCRLKEGFTVFRDQSFSADMGSAAVKRIEDVRLLRAVQFPEDSGPLAHPVRPDSYIEISNFYTATVYNKGAELIRMIHTVLGPEKFRAGTDLYFDRHDGQAATCDDFVKAMEDASGVDLSAFKIWYSQAGTPKVTARLEHDPEARTADASPRPDRAADPRPARQEADAAAAPDRADRRRQRRRDRARAADPARQQQAKHSLRQRRRAAPAVDQPRFFGAGDRRCRSALPGELELLAQHDSDPFARFEAMQELMLRELIAGTRGEPVDSEPLIRAIGNTLKSNALDAAFKAEVILPPSESLIGDRMELVDPDAIHAARERLRATIGAELRGELVRAHSAETIGNDLGVAAKGARRLKSVALGLLAAGDPASGAELAKAQFDAADNMTDRQGALAVLASLDAPRARGRARRLLRPLQGRSAGGRQMVRAAGVGAAARDHRRGRAPRRPPRVHPRQPQPPALAGRHISRPTSGRSTTRRGAAIDLSPT